MYRACLGMIARASGTGFRAGMSVPTDEHGLLKRVGFLVTGPCWTLPVIHGMNREEWECGDDCLAVICVSVIIITYCYGTDTQSNVRQSSPHSHSSEVSS
jgi:hypothetical protein